MSEQDRVDTPEHDDVEAHKHHMTDDPDAGTESEDVEAHGRQNAAWQDSDAEEGRSPAASDSDDFEAHSKHPA